MAFTSEHALIASHPNARIGKGSGSGGMLNLLNLMVYAVAKECGEPLLCTGNASSTTDLVIYPASRVG